MFFKNLMYSIFHNISAGVLGAVVPIIGGAIANGPTGGALDYATHNPWMLTLWAVGAMTARDKLKNVPIFAQASGTVAPIQAAQAQAATTQSVQQRTL